MWVNWCRWLSLPSQTARCVTDIIKRVQSRLGQSRKISIWPQSFGPTFDSDTGTLSFFWSWLVCSVSLQFVHSSAPLWSHRWKHVRYIKEVQQHPLLDEGRIILDAVLKITSSVFYTNIKTRALVCTTGGTDESQCSQRACEKTTATLRRMSHWSLTHRQTRTLVCE